MAVTEFSIGCSKTINLGNYQSIRIEASVTVNLNQGDSLMEAEKDAQDELTKLLEQTYKDQYKQAKDLT